MAKKNDFRIVVRYGTNTPNISRYFSDVNKIKSISPEEEARLAVLAKQGDQKAKEKIIKSNLKFAISVAKFYANNSCPLEDLISEANKGLVEAIESFDPTTGFKFISYAVWHIKKNIMLYIGNLSQTVRIPGHVQKGIRDYLKVFDTFNQEVGRDPEFKEVFELMEYLGMEKLSKNAVQTIKNKPTSVPLDPLINSSSDEERLLPINYIESGEKADSILQEEDKRKVIEKLISCLKPLEKEIIELKYGLTVEIPMNYREIGEKFDKTSEWARQKSVKAEKKLKSAAKKSKIKNWWT